MFQTLKQGSPVWVMDKSNLTLQVGSVATVTLPTSYNSLQWMPQLMQGQTIDISVTMEDGTQSEFKQLQPTMSVAQYGNVIICDTQECMAKEVDALDRQSQQVIDSVQYHQKARIAYEEMKKMLSPSYAKERDTDARLYALENCMGDIKSMMTELIGKKKATTN